MNKYISKNASEICQVIDQIIEVSDNKPDYQYLYNHLKKILATKFSYDDIALICETILKMAKTKNRIIRHLEKDFWDFIQDVPSNTIMHYKHRIAKDEELVANTDYKKPGKKIASRILGLAHEIMEIKDDNSKASGLRRSGSLSLIGDLICYYKIPFAKKLFVDSINSIDPDIQYAALQGLENYYSFTNDKIEAALLKNIQRIHKKTDDRTIASTCLQIQIEAGLINQLTAVFRMDDWKDKHYRF